MFILICLSAEYLFIIVIVRKYSESSYNVYVISLVSSTNIFVFRNSSTPHASYLRRDESPYIVLQFIVEVAVGMQSAGVSFSAQQ